MKKFLLALSLSTLIIGCNNDTTQKQPEPTAQTITEPIVQQTAETQNNESTQATENTQTTITESTKDSENLDTSFNMSEKFLDFEKNLIRKYKDKGVRTVYVAPYSKGTDIVFVTLDKNMTKKEFIEIAKNTVKEFKREFGFEKDTKIGVALDYQKDPTVNTENLFSITLK